jgi:hypothetical protein
MADPITVQAVASAVPEAINGFARITEADPQTSRKLADTLYKYTEGQTGLALAAVELGQLAAEKGINLSDEVARSILLNEQYRNQLMSSVQKFGQVVREEIKANQQSALQSVQVGKEIGKEIVKAPFEFATAAATSAVSGTKSVWQSIFGAASPPNAGQGAIDIFSGQILLILALIVFIILLIFYYQGANWATIGLTIGLGVGSIYMMEKNS